MVNYESSLRDQERQRQIEHDEAAAQVPIKVAAFADELSRAFIERWWRQPVCEGDLPEVAEWMRAKLVERFPEDNVPKMTARCDVKSARIIFDVEGYACSAQYIEEAIRRETIGQVTLRHGAEREAARQIARLLSNGG